MSRFQFTKTLNLLQKSLRLCLKTVVPKRHNSKVMTKLIEKPKKLDIIAKFKIGSTDPKYKATRIVCFTDGSKCQYTNKCGFGVLIYKDSTEIWSTYGPFGVKFTSMQAEIFAIHACSKILWKILHQIPKKQPIAHSL